MENRHNVKGQVDEVHQPRPNAKGGHVRKDMLDVDPQQAQERHEKMAENNDHPDAPPASLFTHHVPEGFFGHVAIPDNEILREMNVGVKDREGKKERANKIILMLVQHVAENALAYQDHGEQVSGGQRQP